MQGFNTRPQGTDARECKPGVGLGPMGHGSPYLLAVEELPEWLNGGWAQAECQNVHWFPRPMPENLCLLGDYAYFS